MTSRTTKHKGRKAVATAALVAFTGAALLGTGVNPALADGPNGGSGGTPGGNLGAAGSLDIRYAFFDDAVPNPQGGAASVSQGWGQDSIDWFTGKAGITGTTMANKLQASCTEALNEAIARGQAAGGKDVQARVVGIMYAINNGVNGGGAARGKQHFYDKVTEWSNAGYPGLSNRSTELDGFISDLARTGADKGSAAANDGLVSTSCVAVNSEEPQGISTPPTYDLTVTTDHASTVTEAGSTTPVYDTIHASRGDSTLAENIDAEVVLTYEGPEGEGGNKSVTKTVSIANNGDTKSPEFTPADFGWTSWPATGEGKTFWFDVHVAKQGHMNEAVDTADREASESWTVGPKNPVKVLTNGETGSGLTEKDVLAANMFYNANITAHSNGYASQLTITDTVNTADVVIGDKETDNPDRVQVLGPNGQRVKADVTIDRSVEGKVVISGTVKDIVDQGNYTLVVPTYTKATGTDYRIPDDSKVCYTEAQDHCLVGNSAETGKVTPDPDKVWTADEAEARTTADPERTNQKGADNKTFLPGDKVSAVVNDYIAAYLQYGLEEYSITDDWSDGLTYVTMDGAPKVYFQGQDVTDLFEITNDTAKGVTTAKAKPEFLAKTARLAEPGEIKLVISGQFRRDYDTDGQNKQLINKGSVTWNNEMKATNEPPIFTVTPKPAIDVEKFTLSEGLEAGDRDEADNALTLQSAKDETQIGFLVTNTGEADLVNVSLADATHEGTTGNVSDIVCEIPAKQDGQDGQAGQAVDSTNDALTGGATAQTVKVAGDKIGTLKVGQSVSCVGTLTGVEEGTLHSDTATVTGESIHNGKKVSDSDDWHAKVDAPEQPAHPAPKGAVTGEAAGANTGLMAALGTLMAAIGLGGGATWFARRKAHVATKH